MANPDDKGQYLARVLKTCRGMIDFSLTDAYSPMLFAVNGYQVVVMPMMSPQADRKAKAEQAKAQKPAEQAEKVHFGSIYFYTRPYTRSRQIFLAGFRCSLDHALTG